MDKNYIMVGKGRRFQISEAGLTVQSPLHPAIFNMSSSMESGIYIEEMFPTFDFPFKIYGLDTDFINHATELLPKFNHNTGILLNGTKGAGKTVTIKVIANHLVQNCSYPVILVNAAYPGLIDFMNRMSQIQTCVWLFDEFEKNFKTSYRNEDSEAGEQILSVMDGTYSSIHKQIFLLTTNNTYINDNLLARPGRVRWLRNYGNLNLSTVIEYLNDNLSDARKLEIANIVDYLNELEIVTIDLLKTIVEELNICDASIEKIIGYLNVKKADNHYHIRYKRIDVDDNDYSSYTKEQFLDECEKNGKTYIDETEEDEDNREKTYWFGIYNTNCAAKTTITFAAKGDQFFYGSIVEPLDEHNVVIVEESDGTRYFILVENPNVRSLRWGASAAAMAAEYAF